MTNKKMSEDKMWKKAKRRAKKFLEEQIKKGNIIKVNFNYNGYIGIKGYEDVAFEYALDDITNMGYDFYSKKVKIKSIKEIDERMREVIEDEMFEEIELEIMEKE